MSQVWFGGGPRTGLWHSIGAGVFAALPLLVLVYLMFDLAPRPRVSVPARGVILAASDDSGGIARAFPGAPAVALDALGAPPRLSRLPFDEVWLAGDTALDPKADGFVRIGSDARGQHYWRSHRWSALASWPRWQPSATHQGVRATCDERRENGGYFCGRGVEWWPELLTVNGQRWALVQVSPVPGGSSTELTLPDAPQNLEGHVWSARGKPTRLVIQRGEVSVTTPCQALCPFLLPPGVGPVTVRVTGPSPGLAFELREASPGGL